MPLLSQGWRGTSWFPGSTPAPITVFPPTFPSTTTPKPSAADSYLQGTDLDWTILGPSSLTEDPGTGMIELDGERSQVTRDDVAQVAAEVLARPETIGKIINFNNGPTPIAEALGTLA